MLTDYAHNNNEKPVVLCIDDDAEMLEVICEVLHSEGTHVQKADNLADGLALIISHHPQVIILDRIIGDEDGRAVLPSIKEFSPNSKVMVLSGYPSAGISQKHQPDIYAVKPISPTELRKNVQRLLN